MTALLLGPARLRNIRKSNKKLIKSGGRGRCRGPAESSFPNTPGLTVNSTFTDFEAYSEAIQDADLDVRLLHPYERSWSIQQRELGTLRVQHGIEGSGLLTRGAVQPEAGHFSFSNRATPCRSMESS